MSDDGRTTTNTGDHHMIELAPREIHALAVIAELCERDPGWLARALPEPADQLAVTTARAKLSGEPVEPTRLARIIGNRGCRHRSWSSLRNSGAAG